MDDMKLTIRPHNGELHDFQSSPIIIRAIKWFSMR
jgi:hypothetical protein